LLEEMEGMVTCWEGLRRTAGLQHVLPTSVNMWMHHMTAAATMAVYGKKKRLTIEAGNRKQSSGSSSIHACNEGALGHGVR
jgi:hypothetical protein